MKLIWGLNLGCFQWTRKFILFIEKLSNKSADTTTKNKSMLPLHFIFKDKWKCFHHWAKSSIKMIIPNKDKLKFCDNRPKNIENSFFRKYSSFFPQDSFLKETCNSIQTFCDYYFLAFKQYFLLWKKYCPPFS